MGEQNTNIAQTGMTLDEIKDMIAQEGYPQEDPNIFFEENKVEPKPIDAIRNMSALTFKNTSFIGNHADSENGEAKGGAIYSKGNVKIAADNGFTIKNFLDFTPAVSGVVLYFLALMSSHLAAFRVESNIRKDAMKRVVEMPLGFFESTTSGRIRKIIDDNAGITHSFLAHQLPDLAATLLVPVIAAVLIFAINWQLGLACMIPLIIAGGTMMYMMNTSSREFMRKYMNSLEEMNTEAVEYVRGIPVVKVFQQTIYSFKNFHRSIQNYNRMVMAYTRNWTRPMTFYTMVINGFAYFLAPVAILMMTHGNDWAAVLADFLFYVLITPVFSSSIMKSMYLVQAVGQADEAVGRLENLLSYTKLSVSMHPKSPENCDIEFRNVSFSYPGTCVKAVDGIDFRLPAGKTYALVGESGGGKTTIARLIPRFWEADEGQILIGGVDVRDILPQELMDNISFVFQQTRLFKTSLLENIRYGRPEASLEEVERAVDAAQCREIIDRLPDGLDTRIGTEGTWLSGGEQQRIALARAILKNAPILVLDEATAFADPENEHLIQQALHRLTKGKTVLMIAHRLSSVTDVDRILVIDKGKIAEQGTHAELINQSGIYSRMWDEYRRSVNWTLGKKETEYA